MNISTRCEVSTIKPMARRAVHRQWWWTMTTDKDDKRCTIHDWICSLVLMPSKPTNDNFAWLIFWTRKLVRYFSVFNVKRILWHHKEWFLFVHWGMTCNLYEHCSTLHCRFFCFIFSLTIEQAKCSSLNTFWLIWDTSQWAYAIMIHESKNAWRLCMLLLARVLIFQTSYFVDISHNALS